MKTSKTFLISHSILPRMRNVSYNSFSGNQNIHFVFYNFLFFENRAVYEIMCKNIVQWGRPHTTIRCMRIACWKTRATHTKTHTRCDTTFARTLFNDMLYIHCLSCSMLLLTEKVSTESLVRICTRTPTRPVSSV
jgi:hypothetical protein